MENYLSMTIKYANIFIMKGLLLLFCIVLYPSNLDPMHAYVS